MKTRMYLRYGFAGLLLAAAVYMATLLVRELSTPQTNEGLAALLGGLVGAVGMALTQAVRDLFNTADEVGGNGHTPKPTLRLPGGPDDPQ